jgi:hypothetical protein
MENVKLRVTLSIVCKQAYKHKRELCLRISAPQSYVFQMLGQTQPFSCSASVQTHVHGMAYASAEEAHWNSAYHRGHRPRLQKMTHLTATLPVGKGNFLFCV